MNKYPNTDFNLKTIQNGNFEIIEIKSGWLDQRNVLNVFHRHTFHEIVWITEGTDFHSVDFEDYNVERNHILCIPKGSIHDFKPSNNTKGWKLIFDECFFDLDQLTLFQQLNLFIPYWGQKLIALKNERVDITEHSIKVLTTLKGKRNQQIVLISFLSFLNDCFELNHSNIDNNFVSFLKLLSKEIYSHREVSYFSELLNISNRTLNDVVKKATGQTTLSYIHARLINEAKSKLLYTRLNIKEIAYSIGFEDALYFSRFFKKRTNSSPEEFRKFLHKYP